MASSGKITLKSSDGEAFEVEESVAVESQTIKHMIEDDCADNAIPLPKVTSKILAKVIEYCKKHVEASKAEDRVNDEDLKAWDAEFVKVDRATLFYLIRAADYLSIKSLLDLTCQTVANMIKGKTLEEIHKTFNINEFTLEEEEEVRREREYFWVPKNPSETMASSRKIKLWSSDEVAFEVELVVMESQLIKGMIKACTDNPNLLPNVTSKILAAAIEYRKKLVEAFKVKDRVNDENLKAWDAEFVKDMIEAFADIIPLLNVTSETLAKVIEYCKKHVESSKAEDPVNDVDLIAWDAEFVKVDQATLFDLILAAKNLDIKSLLDLTCQKVADMIKGKPPEEVRKTFNIKNEFTPGEEEEVRRENQWAFE